MDPCISIVTPSYNQAEYLEQTILSIAAQDYPRFEHIVIDGGSSDASPELLSRHAAKLKHWVSEKDRGQTHAINKGMAHTSGEIVAYLNSDDYYLPGTFAAVAEAYRQHPDADLFVGRCRYVDAGGATIGGQFGKISSYAEALDLWNVWWGKRQFVQPEVFWTRRIMEKVGPFTEQLRYVMDYDYWARILRAGGKVVMIDRELSAFRFTPNQKSNQSSEVSDELLDLVKPWIWDPDSPIDAATRRRLKNHWEFHGGFLRLRDRLVAEGTPRVSRWLSLLGFLSSRPSLACSGKFRELLAELAKRNDLPSQPQAGLP